MDGIMIIILKKKWCFVRKLLKKFLIEWNFVFLFDYFLIRGCFI